jgi:hypothetical protein
MRENVLAKRAVVVGVRGLGQGLRVRVGDEGLLSRNDQVFPERPGQEVSPVGLQPVDVALGSFILGPCPRDHVRVVDLFQNQMRINYNSTPLVLNTQTLP